MLEANIQIRTTGRYQTKYFKHLTSYGIVWQTIAIE